MKKTGCLIFVALLLIFVLPFLLDAKTKGVKTSYKRYSIYKYKNKDVLCEPYTVRKNDWLYKIFRKKGEISEKDFPKFLVIFKKINPQISNIDAIEAGINILIPLKQIKKQDYDQSTPGTVDVPVIEFSTTPEDLNLDPFIKDHTIEKGETISNLLDKDFLKKGGRISEEGLKAFQLANPNIKNINIVYEGAQIYLPDPSIKSQPWFRSLLGKKKPAEKTPSPHPDMRQTKIQDHELAQLKKYASLIGGTLFNHGQMYFPGNNGNKGKTLDLSTTPVIEAKDGSKILILSGNTINRDLLEHIQAHWKNLRTQALSESLSKLKQSQSIKSKKNRVLELQKMITDLLRQANQEYHPNVKIPFTFNNIRLEARFGKIVRKETTDLLINFGNVYGSALDVLKKREFKIISITPKLSPLEVIDLLLSHLDYTTWANPSFFTGNAVESIKGIYAVKKQKKLFIPIAPLSTNAVDYLKKENIKIISLNKHSILQ